MVWSMSNTIERIKIKNYFFLARENCVLELQLRNFQSFQKFFELEQSFKDLEVKAPWAPFGRGAFLGCFQPLCHDTLACLEVLSSVPWQIL